ARYGDFADVSLVGLVEGEWPERPPHNIFYSASLLNALGWPSERDRRAGADARFVDLLASSKNRVGVSTITLDDEMLVEPAALLDDLSRSGLPTRVGGVPSTDAAENPTATDGWADLRSARTPSTDPSFHG